MDSEAHASSAAGAPVPSAPTGSLPFGPLELEQRGSVATVRFGDANRHNPLTLETLTALRAVAGELAERAARGAVGVVVLTGRGRDFSSGADLREVAAAAQSEARARAYVTAVQAGIEAWAALPCVTMAALEGWVLGGGLELAAACSLRVAAQDASLGLPEMRLGLHPAAGGLTRLPRLLGTAWTLRLVLSGESVGPDALVGTGFLAAVAPSGEALVEALRWGERLAAAGPAAPWAAAAIAADEHGHGPMAEPLERGLARERDGFVRCVTTPAARRRLSAFLAGARDAGEAEGGR